MWKLIVLIPLLAGLGCGDDEDTDTDEQEVSAPTQEGLGSGEIDVAAMEAASERLSAAVEEAGEQAEPPTQPDPTGDPCVGAFQGLVAMRTAIQQRLGNAGQSPMPDREAYLQACNELPEPARRCMSIPYSAAHRDDCQRAMAAVPAEAQQKMRSVTNAEPPPPEGDEPGSRSED